MSKPKYGSFLTWGAIEEHTAHLHDIGIQHLIKIWPNLRDRTGDESYWGDEVEYQLIRLDDDVHEAHIVPRQDDILQELDGSSVEGEYDPEFTKFQIESSPSEPYTSSLESLLEVEGSLATRRKTIGKAAGPRESPFTLSLFPLLGIPELTKALPVTQEDGKEALFKEAVASVGRHQTLEESILRRRGRKYHADVPLFIDGKTAVADSAAGEDVITKDEQQYIHLEHLVFSMGGCGLQATFQTSDFAAVRTLHDQLCVLGPILLALTAATPIYKGLLAATDARWNQACTMVDDRRPDEMKQLTSRWSCSPAYICTAERALRPGLQHPSLVRDADVEARLEAAGFDAPMATYFANLHQRDPLVLFADADGGEDPKETSPAQVHQSICGSVWSHVRLKLPPETEEEGDSADAAPQGWMVEFRPMEVQLTDFANAAFLVFMQLLRQALDAFDLDIYMPLAQVEENMDRAHARNAVVDGKFWFPQDPRPQMRKDGDIRLASIDEIVNGAPGSAFEGLIPFVRRHLRGVHGADGGDGPSQLAKLDAYLDFVSARASGRDKTPAQWQREFVRGHADYARDSKVTPRIAYDMMKAIQRMNDD